MPLPGFGAVGGTAWVTFDGMPIERRRRCASRATVRRRAHSVGTPCCTCPSDSNSPARNAARTTAGDDRTRRGIVCDPLRHKPLTWRKRATRGGQTVAGGASPPRTVMPGDTP